MSDATLRRLAVWAFVARLALLAVWLVFGWLTRGLHHDTNWSTGGYTLSVVGAIPDVAFPLTGLVIARRQPRSTVAWILLAIGICWGISDLSAYADYGLILHPGSLPAAAAVAAISSSFWIPPIGLTGTFLILYFPDGRLPSPRWRWAARWSVLVIVAGVATLVLTPGKLGAAGYPHVVNPLGVHALGPELNALHLIILGLPIGMIAAAAGLVVRFRRSHGVERQQLKWLAAAAAVVAGIYLVVEPLSAALGSGRGAPPAWLGALQNVALFSFGLIPVAIGFAVLRHRLYDIDLIIRRTLVYTALVAVLGAAYLGGVAGLGAAFRSLTGQSGTLAVTLSTLAVAAAFQPARTRIQNAVDRRFARDRYDAERALAGLAQRLREGVELDGIRDDVLAVVETTVRPRHAHVWLRSGEEAR